MFVVLVFLFILTLPIYLVVFLVTPADLYVLPAFVSETPVLLGVCNGLFIHILFFFTYVEFFYYVTRAVTLRILVEILNCSGMQATIADIQRGYNVRAMVLSRLESMRQNGFILMSEGRFINTAKGS